MNGEGPDGAYTIAGVVAFLNREFQSFERDRKLWEEDRVDLQARITVLMGEKDGLERVQKDLLRRVKMLEFALNQEKQAKGGKVQEPPKKEEEKKVSSPTGPLSPTSGSPLSPKRGALSSQTLPAGGLPLKVHKDPSKGTSSRSILRRWLAEFGYGKDEDAIEEKPEPPKEVATVDKVATLQALLDPVDFSNHVDKLIDRTPVEDREAEVSGTVKVFPLDMGRKFSASAAGPQVTHTPLPPTETTTVPHMKLDDVSPLVVASTATPSIPTLPPANDSSKEVISDIVETMSDEQLTEMFGNDGTKTKNKRKTKRLIPGSGTLLMTKKVAASSFTNMKTLATARSHLDSVRCVAWHSKEALFLSAGEDFTVKLWSLQHLDPKLNTRSKSASKQGVSKDKEVLPARTYRGHKGPVLSVAFWEANELVLSAGMDGNLCLWTMPEDVSNANQCVDGDMFLSGCYTGHTDGIWDIQVHPKEDLALTASADGSVKLWKLGSARADRHTFVIMDEVEDERDIPTSVAWNTSDLDLDTFVAVYVSGRVIVWNKESESPVNSIKPDMISDAAELHAYRIIVHPHEPLAITAHEDKKIRFWDLTSGTLSDTLVAHQDAVSDISVDSSGLYLASVGHDVSLRIWSLEDKKCLQEIPVHSRKSDEGIHSVDFHPSLGWLITGGADSIIKVFE